MGVARTKNLKSNLYQILNIVPERDVLIELEGLSPEFFEATNLDPQKWQFELVFMQLAKYEYHFGKAARYAVRTMLCDFDCTLTPAVRVFASDLLDLAPITAPKENTTLVRDILIIMALRILKELGHNPTRNEASKGDHLSGSQIVFEYLCIERKFTFAENATTISRIWSNRRKRFEAIDLDGSLLD
mgnify:CR=1 FL=1